MIAGIQISSFSPLLKTPGQVADVFRRCARIGCQAVQLQWIDPAVPVEEVARALAAAGLYSVSVQDFYADVVNDLSYYTALCARTGSRWLCVSRIPEPYRSVPGLAEFARALDDLAGRIAPLGLQLCFHPTSPDYRPTDDGAQPIPALMQAVNRPLSLCLDLYHAHMGGAPMAELLYRYAGKVCMVHFKDFLRGPDGQTTLVPAGQGEIDFRSAIAACLETGVPYGFVEQESWSRDPFVCIEEALQWLRDSVSGV